MATQARSNRFSSKLPTEIDVIINELGALDHLDILGVDLDVTRRDLDRFKHGSLNDFDRIATRGEQVIGLLHERLKNSIEDQVLERALVEGDTYPRPEINGVIARTLEHVAKKHYETTSATEREYISLRDLSSEKNPFSSTLTAPEKEYIVRSIDGLSQGAQQAAAQALAKAKRLQSLPFKATLSLIDTATRIFAVDAKVVGLPYEHIAANHFPDASQPNIDLPQNDVQMIIGYAENSRHFDKLPLDFAITKQKLEQAELGLPDGVSGRLKMAVLHQALEESVIQQAHDNARGHILSVDMMRDARNGLREVARAHYDNSATAESFIATYSMHTTLTHAPLPESLSAEQYLAISSSTDHLSQGARQYVAANLSDQKSNPDFDFNGSVDVIKRSLQAFDGAITHVGVLSPTQTLNRFDVELAAVGNINTAQPVSTRPVQDNTATLESSTTLKQLIAIIDSEGFNKASKLDLKATENTLTAFEARLPVGTDQSLRMALIHHELESMAIKSTKERFAGKSQGAAYDDAIKATKLESFYTARAHYDASMTDTATKERGFIRFVSRDNNGLLKKAPFPNALSSSEHDVLLKTMQDFTQGQKQFIASSVRDFTQTTKGTKPELSIETVKSALTSFDTAYRHARPNNYIDSNADFDIRRTLLLTKPQITQNTAKNESKPANIATKYDFGDAYANLMLEGLGKEGLTLKKSYNDPKSTTDMLYNGTKNFLKNIDTLSSHAAHLSNTAQGDDTRLGLIKTALGRVGQMKEGLAQDAGRKGFLNKAGNISLNADFDHTTKTIDSALTATDSALRSESNPSLSAAPRSVIS